MSAINLYVAVDWQGDKEIERARREEGWREEGDDDCRRNAGRECEESWGRGEIQSCDRRKGKNAKRRVIQAEEKREREYTNATDTPFLLIEIQFERSKPGNSEEIELSRYYRARTIYPYISIYSALSAHQATIRNERARDRDISRIIKTAGNYIRRIYTFDGKNCSVFKIHYIAWHSLPFTNDNSYVAHNSSKRDRCDTVFKIK